MGFNLQSRYGHIYIHIYTVYNIRGEGHIYIYIDMYDETTSPRPINFVYMYCNIAKRCVAATAPRHRHYHISIFQCLAMVLVTHLCHYIAVHLRLSLRILANNIAKYTTFYSTTIYYILLKCVLNERNSSTIRD